MSESLSDLSRLQRSIDAIVRDRAIIDVDNQRGYSVEYASDPTAHRAAWDQREDELRAELGITWESSR